MRLLDTVIMSNISKKHRDSLCDGGKSRMENKIISIIGLGLIGGSIALGIKRAHPDYQVIGYDTSEKSRASMNALLLMEKLSMTKLWWPLPKSFDRLWIVLIFNIKLAE